MIFEATHHMALLPLLWLGGLAFHGHPRDVEWWALASTFGISWLADTLAHTVDPWLVSALYPVVQASLLGMLLLPAPAAWRFVLLVIGAGIVALLVRGVARPDVFVRTVAWVGIVLLVWPQRSRLRLVVLSTFGLSWLGWIGYSLSPGWATWGTYQGVRALGLGVFCWAAWHPFPRLQRVAV